MSKADWRIIQWKIAGEAGKPEWFDECPDCRKKIEDYEQLFHICCKCGKNYDL